MAEQKQPNQSKGNNTGAAANTAAAPKLTPEQIAAKKTGLFKELAPKRTRQVLKSLDILGNCSNRSGYNYTEEQVSKIFSTIEKKVAETKQLFNAKAKQAESTFTLD